MIEYVFPSGDGSVIVNFFNYYGRSEMFQVFHSKMEHLYVLLYQ